MKKEHGGTDYREAYPAELESAEEKLLKVSRSARSKAGDFKIRDCTGVGLSGGGIRSATFCLGLFQGLAGRKLLGNIDIISTVSGGGYFGSFYTRFFMRKEVPDFQYMQQTLAPATADSGEKDPYQRSILTWLRENGRYLSPKGSGDLLAAGTVLLRNWAVVQIVLAVFFLMLFLSAQLLRIQLDQWFYELGVIKPEQSEMVLTLLGSIQLWISPFLAFPLLLLLFGAVPLGWAYWMVGRQPPGTKLLERPSSGLIFIVVAACAALLLLPQETFYAPYRAASRVVLALSVLTALWAWGSDAYSRHSAKVDDPATGAKYRESFKDNLSRHLVSVQLKAVLVAAGAALALVAIDSLGQTIYLIILTPGATLGSWGGGLLGLLFALVPFATRIMISLRGTNSGKRPRALTQFAAAAAAAVVITTMLCAFNVAANAIAWGGKRPLHAPGEIGEPPAAKLVDARVVPDPGQPNNWSMRSDDRPPMPEMAQGREMTLLWSAWGVSILLSFLFGQAWPFLNRSTQLPLYSARLTRAYLGASNPRRFGEESWGHSGGAVTRVIPGDDIDIDYYYPWPAPHDENCEELNRAKRDIYKRGTPLHLVNVTINETLDSKSQVQQQDRKGIGMALGPAAISAGVHHHVVFDQECEEIETFPREGFRMFNYGKEGGGRLFTGERLPLGQWLAISGAAFSTGLGARTSLALSLLTGVANIRLGYWWDSGIAPRERLHRQKRLFSQWLGAKFTFLFPVQSYLLDEYTARYHGTARRYWNLSDGGHFENMGGYELIRRRLRTIVIVDAEADPDYTFGGLAELIRKARIDFGATIKFLEQPEIDRIMPRGYDHCFGALENLRRGKWVEENLPQLIKQGKRQTIDPVDYQRHSLAHAALARVTYGCDAKAQCCLIYIKPTIIGDEPLDVLQYHVENPTFPQQTTADQFFDEAQWESYRALGEHIANHMFAPPAGRDVAGWWEELAEKVLEGEIAERAN